MKIRFPAADRVLPACRGDVGRAESINGQSYVSLAGWARANGFAGYTLNRGEEIILTNKTSRLVFDTDSAEAQINGVNVRLSYAVSERRADFAIGFGQDDSPAVFSPRKLPPKKITTICLDPGHGGRDTGYRVGLVVSTQRKNLHAGARARTARPVATGRIQSHSYPREKTLTPELPVRPDIANRNGADLFVSLHFNSSPADPANVLGPETYCITPVGAASSNDSEGAGAGHGACPANRVEDKSLLLAFQMQKSLVKNLGLTDRSVRRARFEVLRTAEMPAILIEGGYLSHPVEGKKIFDSGYRKQMAAALVKGILNFQKLTAPPPPKTSPASTNKVFSVKRAIV